MYALEKKITKTKNNNDVTLVKCCTHLYTTQGDDTHTQTRTKKPKTLLPFIVVVAVQNEEEDQREKKRERKTRLVQYLRYKHFKNASQFKKATTNVLANLLPFTTKCCYENLCAE